MHTHVTCSTAGPSLWQVLPGFPGTEDKGPEEAPASPVPQPIPHQGHLEQMGSPPPTRHWNHFTSLCPPGSSQPDHQLTRTFHPIWEGEKDQKF